MLINKNTKTNENCFVPATRIFDSRSKHIKHQYQSITFTVKALVLTLTLCLTQNNQSNIILHMYN